MLNAPAATQGYAELPRWDRAGGFSRDARRGGLEMLRDCRISAKGGGCELPDHPSIRFPCHFSGWFLLEGLISLSTHCSSLGSCEYPCKRFQIAFFSIVPYFTAFQKSDVHQHTASYKLSIM